MSGLGYDGVPWYVLFRKYECTRPDSLYVCTEWSQVDKDGKRRLFVSNGSFHEEVVDHTNNLTKFSKDVDDVRKKAFKTQGLQ